MIEHIPQINQSKILKHSQKKIEVGEDGYVLIENILLEPLVSQSGFLTNVEDADEYSDGGVIVCGTDGDFAYYKYDQSTNNYLQSKLPIKITDDCIYSIESFEKDNHKYFKCYGEKNIIYEFKI
ncbi:MAG: hypothetical protein QG614_86 [Patescibacteria group bacterium]|nr:hypothetical protein [Patescibacteria group bacterium]